MFVYTLKKIIAVVIAAVMILFTGMNGADQHTVYDKDSLEAKFSVISDVHVEGNNYSRYKAFARILGDIKNCDVRDDITVFLGDNTMNGQDIESMLFYGTVMLKNTSDNYIAVLGNHDVGNGNDDQPYDKLFSRYCGYNKAMLGNDISTPYYCKVINGYYYITIGQETNTVHEMYMGEEQLEWLDATCAEAAENGSPIFIFCHFPPNYLVDENEQDSDALIDILSQYDDVFYFCGHTHVPFIEWWTFREMDGIQVINLPRCTDLTGDDNEIDEDTGDGFVVEVYEDEVVVRGRNFYHGEWEEGFERTFALGS